MGVVRVAQRSLRLLTLLTLMASALCAGQTFAAQDITAQSKAVVEIGRSLVDVTEPVVEISPPPVDIAGSIVDIVDVPAVAPPGAGDHTPASIAALSGDAHAATLSAWRFEPASAMAPNSIAPVALQPVAGEFSPRAERAPPAASA